MSKKILVLHSSPIKQGNTTALVSWFSEAAQAKGAEVELIHTAFLKYKTSGCISCRKCQEMKEYACVVKDEAAAVLKKMIGADVIVMATPLYFFGPSAQLKLVLDRMFSLYKWDNKANTMTTPLQGKKLFLIASAYEDIGLKELERPFAIIAEYTGMGFESLLVPDAGESGDILKKEAQIRPKAAALGARAAL